MGIFFRGLEIVTRSHVCTDLQGPTDLLTNLPWSLKAMMELKSRFCPEGATEENEKSGKYECAQ